MFGPTCKDCGSDDDWLLGKDGEECSCGWPHNETEIKKGFGDTEFGFFLGLSILILSLLLGFAALIYVSKL